jgi:hypothetical protein
MLHPPHPVENHDVADADVCNMLTADAADDVLAALPLSFGSSAMWGK